MKFTHKGVEHYVDDYLCCKRATNKPGYRTLTEDFLIMGYVIPKGFEWDGASSPATPAMRMIAPKFYKTLVASCLHDYLCGKGHCDADRKLADKMFYIAKKYLEDDKSVLSYIGVRIGAMFGIGNSFD